MGLQQLRLRIAPFTARPSAPIWHSLASSIRFFRPRLSRAFHSIFDPRPWIHPSIPAFCFWPSRDPSFQALSVSAPGPSHHSSLATILGFNCHTPCGVLILAPPRLFRGSSSSSSSSSFLSRICARSLAKLLSSTFHLRRALASLVALHTCCTVRTGMALCEQTICVAILTRGNESGKHVERGAAT